MNSFPGPDDGVKHNGDRTPGMSRRKLLIALGAAGLSMAAGLSPSPARAAGNTAMYHAKDYGAFGFGRYDQDDAPPLQTALNSAGQTGGILYIPAGTYRLSASLIVPSNVTIVGAGKQATILQAANPRISIFTLPKSKHVSIHGFSFKGLGTYSISSGNLVESGIQLNEAADVHISNCEFAYIVNGIRASDSSSVYIEECTFENIFGTLDAKFEGYGVWCSASTAFHITACTFKSLYNPCITLTNGCSRFHITDNQLSDCYHVGILLASLPTEKPCEHNMVTGNMLINFTNSSTASATCGIRLKGHCKMNVIARNQLSSVADAGIVCAGDAAAANERPLLNRIESNVLRFIGHTGISLLNASDNTVTANELHACKVDGIILYTDGKDKGSASSKNRITFNSIGSSGKAAVRIADDKCAGNLLFGNVGADNGEKIVDKGSKTVTSSL